MALQMSSLTRLMLPSLQQGRYQPLAHRIQARLSQYFAFPPSLAAAFLIPWLSIPSIPSIWGSILRAVPKKKTSHSRTRSRQLAGKALKDVKALNRCSGCGKTKMMHTLCPHCVQAMKDLWAGRISKDGIKPETSKKDVKS